ncbi:MAG: asparagine synthase (glutamine-hydrolyzing) [Acidobacteriota bacterium]|nr:asparagine synthase (glutamine-hydrolyzing) [Acidobacteriota bacterium]MDH3784725.1 asparagine synthase (glutamine-hydrolyzing) [Acidobacteriota bacterium]
MCGIVGFCGFSAPDLLEQMTKMLTHRGPDDSGTFEEGAVSLGHRRLSIIDIAGGHQPMFSPDRRYVIVFNGEIYNYRELRQTLIGRGYSFRSDSDTEVLLACYAEFGVDALDRLNGMFAFAIYDREEKSLFLARDRVGIKPLYTLQVGDRFLFSSESKTFCCWNEWNREVNLDALQGYLALRYVPGNTTLLKGVRRLPAGHYLIHRRGETRTVRYWTPPTGDTKQNYSSEGEAIEALGEQLERSVQRRLISDVPVGAYLSGGLDSSLIVALMTRQKMGQVNTFSVGFDYEHDELREAEATADLLGCKHHTIQCGPTDIDLLQDVVYHSDDPLGDPISLPMYKLAHEAKKQVTVILTGEGADEFFGGYLFHKVLWLADLYTRIAPRLLRRGVVHPLLRLTPPGLLNLAFKYPASLGRRGKLKLLDFHDQLEEDDLDARYRHLISLFDRRDTDGLFHEDVLGEIGSSTDIAEDDAVATRRFDEMLRLQFGHWLPDNMLLRQDKMSMAAGIEGRVPFLDHELIEFAFGLPRKFHIRRLIGKYCLRRVAEGLLPRTTARRRKMPFYVPVEGHFGNPRFLAMMEDLIGDEAVRRRGIFRPEAIQGLRKALHDREFILAKQVFSLMTLELWFRSFIDGSGSRRLTNP